MFKLSLFCSLLLSGLGVCFAVNQAKMIHFDDNSSISFQASISNINRIFIPNDKIIQHVAPQGTFIFDQQLSKDGSLYFKPLYSSVPFTIFFTTEAGHHFSALVMPVNEDGKTIEMVPNNVILKNIVWKKSDGYLKLLHHVMLGMIKNEVMPNFIAKDISSSKSFDGYPNTQMRLIKTYDGNQLDGFIYRIVNNSKSNITLEERKFWRRGVRSISFSDHVLAPNQIGFVYTILSKDGS